MKHIQLIWSIWSAWRHPQCHIVKIYDARRTIIQILWVAIQFTTLSMIRRILHIRDKIRYWNEGNNTQCYYDSERSRWTTCCGWWLFLWWFWLERKNWRKKTAVNKLMIDCYISILGTLMWKWKLVTQYVEKIRDNSITMIHGTW